MPEREPAQPAIWVQNIVMPFNQTDDRSRWSARLSIGLEVLILLAAVMVVWELGHRFFAPRVLAGVPHGVQPGAQLHWPGVAWNSGEDTLALILKVNCEYCEANADFYRTLISAVQGRAIRTLAMLPEAPEADAAYLKALGVHVSQVRQASFARLGVPGAPIIVLAGPAGRVRAAWFGNLSFPREESVFREVGATARSYNGAPARRALGAAAAARRLRAGAVLVDIRNRAAFAHGHLAGAMSIPLDELAVRAPHELPAARDVLIYCHWCGGCEAAKGAEGLTTYCSVAVVQLRNLGYSSVGLVGADLRDLRAQRLRIVGSAREP